MDTHRTRIGVLAVVMAVVGLAGPICGSSAQQRVANSYAESELATGEGLQLKLTLFEKRYDGGDYSYIDTCQSYSKIPDLVPDRDYRTFCYGSFSEHVQLKNFDTGFYFHYDILIPNGTGGWRPSGYWVDGTAKVPALGEHKIGCAIKLSGSVDAAAAAPFSCATSWTGSGATSEPHWKVTARPVQVIDASKSANVDRAAGLIAANCAIADTPRCVWTRTQKSSVFLPSDQNEWQSLTNWADSCPPTDRNHLFVLNSSRNVQISWSDSFGGKVSLKVTGDVMVYKVEALLEVNYQHSITQSDSYGEGYTYTIPYNYRSALYLQHGMLQVSGDFSIITDTDLFLIKNAVFRFPIQKDVLVEGRGQRVPRGVVQHVDVPCSEKAPANEGLPPRKAMHGLATKSP
jgi:hypothetical protein